LTEELARGWMSLTGVIGSHGIVCYLIASHGTEEQRERFLPGLARGERRSGIAITEPDCGSDVAAVRTSARREGADYLVNGTKMFVTNSDHGTMFGVVVKTNPQAEPPHRGISLLLIEKGSPRFRVSRHLRKLGYRGVRTGELVFEDCRVPPGNLLGEENRGFPLLMDGMEVGRIQVAARALGLARAAFEDSIRYAQHRRAFGQTISNFQAIKFKLADMATEIECARQMIYLAASRKDRGERCDLEAGMAKLFATEMAERCTSLAINIHGGIGYIQELPVERYFRDAKLLTVGEGTNDIQRLVIARRLLEKYRA
ncbi:MAG: acyl-CoA dehydrogenase family protein, partial [Nitrospinota bacterium]